MPKYAELTDAIDPALSNLEERHLLKADVYVDAKLAEIGINPADLILPKPVLTELAAAWALRMAAIEGAMGDGSPLNDKAKQYERNAELLTKTLSREALGLSPVAGSGLGYFAVGRG